MYFGAGRGSCKSSYCEPLVTSSESQMSFESCPLLCNCLPRSNYKVWKVSIITTKRQIKLRWIFTPALTSLTALSSFRGFWLFWCSNATRCKLWVITGRLMKEKQIASQQTRTTTFTTNKGKLQYPYVKTFQYLAVLANIKYIHQYIV